jgi:hypothetical protein
MVASASTSTAKAMTLHNILFVALYVAPASMSKEIYNAKICMHAFRCEILDQLRLEITYQYAINHIDPYEGRNNIVHAQESGYLPIRIGGSVFN